MKMKKFQEFRNHCLITAEVGINHNGNLDIAKEAIKQAAEAGADCVKFQNYKTEDFVADKNIKLTTRDKDGNLREEHQYELFKKCELNSKQLRELKETCDRYNVIFHSTPTNEEGIRDLVEMGSQLLKNGSDYLTNHRMVSAMAKTKLPTILSTGMSTYDEIEKAVNIFRKQENENLMLLHCTSNYPTLPINVNLSRIKTLREEFGVPVGFSDHTEGDLAAIGSVFYGSVWIEKHFTIDKHLDGPDHWFSIDKDELATLVTNIRNAETMIGNAKLTPTQSEIISREEFRLSCVASRDINEGEIVCQEDIAFKRPGIGFSPYKENLLIGKILTRSIREGEIFTASHTASRQ